jgi:hypothetical protein
MGETSLWPIVAGLLGGSAAAAIFNAWWSNTERIKGRRADYLAQQLQDLYGPIHFRCGQSTAVTAHIAAIERGNQREYPEPLLVDSEMAKEADQVRKVIDRYSEFLLTSNRRIAKILFEHYPLIDPEDVEVVQSFALSTIRYQIECSKDEDFSLPERMHPHTGDIQLFTTAFADRITKQFTMKSAQLAAFRTDATCWNRAFQVSRNEP